MNKKIIYFILFFFPIVSYATVGAIHITTMESSWCGNLAVSTKVGKMTDAGQCQYLYETKAYAVDNCDPLPLNGIFLEKNAGLGYNCAATHVHSNVTGKEGFDAYTLVTDAEGHYVNTTPYEGNINLTE